MPTKIGSLRKAGISKKQAANIAAASVMVVPFHMDAGANFTMTSATQAERNAGNTARHIRLVDLTGFSRVRLVVNVQTESASVNTPKVLLSYSDAYGGTYTALAEVSVFTGTAATVQDSGWQVIPAAARTAVYLALREIGGNASASPAVGNVVAYFDALGA